MTLVLYGANHKSLDVDRREQIAVSEAELPSCLTRLYEQPGIREAALLSTCNRVEILLVCSSAVEAPKFVRSVLREIKAVDIRPWQDSFYCLHEREAARHLFRVITSLDALVVGEVEIVRQVKDAYRQAVDTGTTGPVLNRLFHEAFRIGKQARSKTQIGAGTVSVSVAAVEMAARLCDGLADKRTLVIGAGKMATQIMRYLRKREVRSLTVANRTRENALPIAEELDASIAGLHEIEPALAEADLAFLSLQYANRYLINRTQLQALDRHRNGRPLVLIDISVPRIVEAQADDLSSVALYSIESVSPIVDANYDRRLMAVPQVEELIETAVERFAEQHVRSGDGDEPGRERLRDRLHSVCKEEVARWEHSLDERNAGELRRFAESLTQRMIHTATHAHEPPASSPRNYTGKHDWGAE